MADLEGRKDSVLLEEGALCVGQMQALLVGLRDDQPSITPANVILHYDVSFDTNFADRGAFASGVSKHVEDAQRHALLVCSFVIIRGFT